MVVLGFECTRMSKAHVEAFVINSVGVCNILCKVNKKVSIIYTDSVNYEHSAQCDTNNRTKIRVWLSTTRNIGVRVTRASWQVCGGEIICDAKEVRGFSDSVNLSFRVLVSHRAHVSVEKYFVLEIFAVRSV